MAATVIGSNTWPVRIGDGATDAAGSWAWYMTPLIAPEVWDFIPIVDLETGDDFSLSEQWGQFRWTSVLQNITVKTKALMDQVKRACRQWNDKGDLLYFQNKLGGVDNAIWAVGDPWNTTEPIRIRIIKVVWKSQQTDDRIGTVYIKRYTEET